MTSRKWMGSYASGRKYRSERVEKAFAWVQKVASQSVCKLWHDCT